MKIDFTKKLMTIKGVPLKASMEPDAPELTLQDIATQGLFTPLPQGEGSQSKAVDAFKLALRISNTPKACEISAAESTMIKEGVGRACGYAPNVCGPVELLLEGDAIVN